MRQKQQHKNTISTFYKINFDHAGVEREGQGCALSFGVLTCSSHAQLKAPQDLTESRPTLSVTPSADMSLTCIYTMAIMIYSIHRCRRSARPDGTSAKNSKQRTRDGLLRPESASSTRLYSQMCTNRTKGCPLQDTCYNFAALTRLFHRLSTFYNNEMVCLHVIGVRAF